MRTVFFGFLIFLIWAAFARYYYVCEIKNLCHETPVTVDTRPQTLDLTYGEEVILEDYNQLAFKKGSRLPSLDDNNNIFLDSVAFILKQQPERSLTITGLFLENEKGHSIKRHLSRKFGIG